MRYGCSATASAGKMFLALAFTILLLQCVSPHDDSSVREGLHALETGDYPTAIALLRPQAERGNKAAQRGVAWVCAFGLGTQEDDAEAAEWLALMTSTKKELAGEEYDIAIESLRGSARLQSKERALRWMERSAVDGCAKAQQMLANSDAAEREGLVVPEAVREQWIARAVDK